MFHFPFLEWFSLHPLVGGDWRFFWPDNISEILNYSYAWDPALNSGFGDPNLQLLSLNSYLAYGAYVLSMLHIPWSIAEKILFFIPIIIFSFSSGYFFLKLITKKRLIKILGGILYLTNTYALMIFSGGQVGIALAYSLFPLVLLNWIGLIDFIRMQKKMHLQTLFRKVIFTSFIMALAVVFESRIFYLCIIAAGLYVVYLLTFSILDYNKLKNVILIFLFSFILPGIIVGLLHSYWILPMLLYKVAPNFKTTLQNTDNILNFLSFAKLENTFSLLHPNWPENIFGKVYFMRVEFIIIPIIAFLFVLLVSKYINKNDLKQNISLIFFIATLSFIGAFLAKGTNEPFGEVYTWLYNFFPGFVMFRDPTKFYIFVAFSYSILIPYSIERMQDYFYSKKNLFKIISKYLVVIFLIFWFFTIRNAFIPGLSGTFVQHTVPDEYKKLKNLIVSQGNFSRTLWVPSVQRFGFSSSLHPALSTNELFATDSATVIAQNFSNKKVQERLKESGIQYIIVPFDSEREIFLSDRKYDKKIFDKYVSAINSVNFLQQDKSFSKLMVYKTDAHYDRVFTFVKNTYTPLTYTTNDPTTYEITITNAKQNDTIIFAEAYNPNWKLFSDNASISSKKYKNELNSFVLRKSGTYKAKIYFEPQNGVVIGRYFSLATLIVCSIYLVISRKEKL